MKRVSQAVLLLLGAILAGVFISALLSKNTPVIPNSSVLPEGVCDRTYSISGIEELVNENGFDLNFSSEHDISECSLVIKNLVPYDVMQSSALSVFQNGKLIYQLTQSSPYSRTQTIPLEKIEGGEPLTISFESSALKKPLMKRPSIVSFALGFAKSQPQIMIAGNEYLVRIRNISREINAGVFGMYFALIIYSYSLWIKARSQRYLLLIISSSILAILSTGLVYFSEGLHLSYNLYTFFFQLFSCFTSILSGAICIFLYYNDWGIRKPKTKDILFILGAFILLFILSQITGIRLYVFLRRLLWIPVLITFYKAIRKGEYGAGILSFSYVLSETILFLMYMSNEWPPATTDVIKMHFRLTDAMYLQFLLCCTIVINNRFGARYTETRELSTELETLVQERTKSLIEAQEQRHNIMQNIFHDLRSPLFVMHHRLDSLQAHDEEENQTISVMKERLSYMEKLTEDLFLVFKLENNEILFDYDDCDLDELLHSLAISGSPNAIERKISIVYDGTPVIVWGDYSRLKQAFQNVLDNAVQYSNEGGDVQILLEEEGRNAVVRIIDHGIGIAPKDIDKVFNRYYRSNVRNPKSSGLGLAIVKEIIKAHKGTIEVQSKEGEGTVFSVRIPLVEGLDE